MIGKPSREACLSTFGASNCWAWNGDAGPTCGKPYRTSLAWDWHRTGLYSPPGTTWPFLGRPMPVPDHSPGTTTPPWPFLGRPDCQSQTGRVWVRLHRRLRRRFVGIPPGPGRPAEDGATAGAASGSFGEDGEDGEGESENRRLLGPLRGV